MGGSLDLDPHFSGTHVPAMGHVGPVARNLIRLDSAGENIGPGAPVVADLPKPPELISHLAEETVPALIPCPFPGEVRGDGDWPLGCWRLQPTLKP
jgi:hypothetical protein